MSSSSSLVRNQVQWLIYHQNKLRPGLLVAVQFMTCILGRYILYLSRSTSGSNLVFFSEAGCHTKVKEPSLPYYLNIARGRRVERMAFLSVLVIYEIQTASFRVELRPVYSLQR